MSIEILKMINFEKEESTMAEYIENGLRNIEEAVR